MKKQMVLAVLAVLAFVFAGCQSEPARISVLGDSYSTFRGRIPDGNAVYYPQKPEKNDVSQAEQCWWYLVAQDLGGTIEKNESWSGSTVCNRGYKGGDATHSSFITRVDRMGNPNLILICGATNDSWAGVPVGEYKWSDWTTEELFTFRPGMAKLLAEVKRIYPTAKVYFILNSQLRPDINESVHEICAHYGVPCIDLHDIEKQSGHPSVKGMRAFADQVVAAVKGK